MDQSVKNVSVDLTDVNTRIDANKTNIEKNATSIANNTNNISKNTENITKNTTAITNLGGRVTVNEQNIADNSKQINENTTNITNNSVAIADNSKQIKVNADNIEVNKQNIVKAKTTVTSNDKTVDVKQGTNADGSTNYDLSIKNGANLDLGDVTVNNIKVKNEATFNNVNATSIKTGDITVGDKVTIKNTGIEMNGTTINMGGAKITNVAIGTDDGDVVNVGQLNQNITNVNKTINNVKGEVTNYVDNSIKDATVNINKDVDVKINNATTDVKKYVDQSVKNVNADLTDVNTRIDANKTNIEKNATSIENNTTNISKNAENITKNTTAIANNSVAIADNSKQIKVNADNIEVNKQNIVKAKTTVTSSDKTVDVKQGTNIDGSTNYDLSIKNGANLDLGDVTVNNINIKNQATFNNINATSIKTGDIVVGDKVTINNTGIDMRGAKITNVGIAVNNGDVVNYGQVKEIKNEINTNITNVKADVDINTKNINKVTNVVVDNSKQIAVNAHNINVVGDIVVDNSQRIDVNAKNITAVANVAVDNSQRIDVNTKNINTVANVVVDNSKQIAVNTHNINVIGDIAVDNSKRLDVDEHNIAVNAYNTQVNAAHIENNSQEIKNVKKIAKAKTTVSSKSGNVIINKTKNYDGSTNYDLDVNAKADLTFNQAIVNNIDARTINVGSINIDKSKTVNNVGINMNNTRITNVAMAVEDNDVVNFKQVNNIVNDVDVKVKNNITNINNINNDVTLVKNDIHNVETNITAVKQDITNVKADVNVKIDSTVKASKTSISSSDNTVAVSSKVNADGSTDYDLKVDLSRVKRVVKAGTNTNVTGSGTQADPYIVNLNNTVDLGNTGSIKFGGNGPSITAGGINAGGTQITNVKAGEKDTDAVNVAQLSTTVEANKVIVKSADSTVAVKDIKNEAGKVVGYDLSVDVSKVSGGSTHLVNGQGTTVTGDGSETNPYKVNIGDTVNVGAKDGVDGKDGKDGSIGVSGKDGSAVVISGKDGSIGLNGKDGKDAVTISSKAGRDGVDGKNGTDGITRIVYKDGKGEEHQVATFDDGMKYGGDTGKAITKHLNEQVNVVGGISDETKLTKDANIGVVSDGENNLTVKLAKDLQGLSSVTTSNGDSTSVLNGDGLTIKKGDTTISLNNDGLNMGNKQITGLQAGVSDTDAVNVGQLRDITHAIGDKVRNITENISNISTAADTNRTTVSSSDNSIKVIDNEVKDKDGKNIKHNYDITINNQAVVENAQTPVVYTDSQGNKVYKQKDGSFNTKVDGSGTRIEAADVVASMNNGAGSTSTAMQLGNVGSAIAGQTGSDYGVKIDNAIKNGAGNNAVNVSDLQANNQYIKNYAKDYTDQQIAAAGKGTHYYSVNDNGVQAANYNNDGATGVNSLAAGVKAVASGEAASAVGYNVVAEGNGSFAAGAGTGTPTHLDATGNGTVNDGRTRAVGNGSVAIGRNVLATGESSIAIGDGATTRYTYTDSNGKVTELYGNEGIAIGHGAVAAGEKSISIGTGNVVLAKGAVVIGDPTYLGPEANGAINLGNDNDITKAGSILLGSNIKNTVENSVFLGDKSGFIPEIPGISLGNKNTGSTIQTVNGVEVRINPANMGTVGVVSVGSAQVHKDANGNITAVDLTTRRLQGVANGLVSPTSTDAVTGSQMYYAQQQANQGIARVERETRDVGALSAAMASLKPLQYDPLEPTTIMAGVGTYHGSHAVALGLAHYTNESTMVNAGVSYASGSNNNVMANAGISWKFGKRSEEPAVADKYRRGPISSTYAMQDEIKAMNEQMAAMQNRNNALEEQVKVLLEKVNKLESK